MSKCLFVTATGTDVGKTYISALLMKKLQKLKLNCTYYKPVLSGAFYENDELILGDCRYVVEQANLDIKPVECSTFYFEEMISPHLAAMRKGVEISSEKILEDFEKKSYLCPCESVRINRIHYNEIQLQAPAMLCCGSFQK